MNFVHAHGNFVNLDYRKFSSKIESVLNRTVCSNLNIHHTSSTPKILKKLGKLNNLYRKTLKKVSEPFDVPVKNVKSRTKIGRAHV